MGLLHDAAAQGDWVEIERLARAGADVNEYDADITPILVAAAKGQVEAVRTLLAFGADPDLADNSVGDSPVFYAASNRHPEAVLALVADRNPERMDEALVEAAAHGLASLVHELLRRGVPPNGEDGFSRALTVAAGPSTRDYPDERRQIVEMLLAAGAKPHPDALYSAAKEKDRSMVGLLMANGAGMTLDAAAALGDVSAIRELALSATRDQVTSAVIMAVDAGEADALHELLKHDAELTSASLHAITSQREDLLQLLLDAGLDPNSRTPDTATPLMYAANRGRPEPMRVLIGAGADVNAQTRNGHTALFRAISGQRIEAVRVLLDAGADPNAVIPGIGSLLTFAVGRNYTPIATMLRQAGGQMRSD